MSAYGNTEADQKLLRSIADNIVGPEVVEVMEAHGWQQGTPPPLAPKTDNPAPGEAPTPEAVVAKGTTPDPASAPKGEEVAKAPADTIDWESLRDPATGKYAGKYTSKSELVKGVGNVVNMAKEAFTRNAALEKELSDLRAGTAAVVTSPAAAPAAAPTTLTEVAASLAAAPVKSEKLAKVLAKIAEEGGMLDAENMVALMDGISDQSRLEANLLVDAKLNARERASQEQNELWNAVDRHMAVTYPRSVDFVDEMGLYVKSHPVLAKAVHALSAQGDHIGATSLAWEAFERTLPPEVPLTTEEQAAAQKREIEGAAQEQVRREAVDAARKQAGVSATSVTGTHESPNVGPSEGEIASAAREMNATGLGVRWRALTIGKDLTGPLFD
jgi:hypothetical protein